MARVLRVSSEEKMMFLKLWQCVTEERSKSRKRFETEDGV